MHDQKSVSVDDIDGLYLFQDWVDYDERKGESVGIYEVEHKFVCVK